MTPAGEEGRSATEKKGGVSLAAAASGGANPYRNSWGVVKTQIGTFGKGFRFQDVWALGDDEDQGADPDQSLGLSLMSGFEFGEGGRQLGLSSVGEEEVGLSSQPDLACVGGGAFVFIGEGKGLAMEKTRVVFDIRSWILGAGEQGVRGFGAAPPPGGPGGEGRARERETVSQSSASDLGWGRRERQPTSSTGVGPVGEREGGEGRGKREREVLFLSFLIDMNKGIFLQKAQNVLLT
ncbi:hypothetical protein TIFTF001_014981 [Ficus carica]|uniref:Uncharacterized protein n=1 Tax=Ficus carica TaxID=3494 RepID=A0AA88A4U2_FICCA|nr:hypothetical protein TIFTF001_014981 [Ficus carica]